MRLHECLGDRDQIDAILVNLRAVITKAEGLGDYPLESLADCIRVFGDVISDSAEYDGLFDATVALMERRSGEGTAGKALLDRGFQLLDADRYYEAIRVIGRAQRKLVKHEYRRDLIMALVACGIAYEQAGLLWAARSNLLAAATRAFAHFTEHGDITRPALLAVRQLAWIERRLGRVPASLQWAQLTDIIARHLMLEGVAKDRFLEKRRDFDMILGLLILKCDFGELKSIGALPNILEALGFDHARIAALYALGYEATLREEGWIPETETSAALRDLMVQWANQPAREQVASVPTFLDRMTTTLSSTVLGCEVSLTTARNPQAIFLAESLLGALEAFLATSLNERIIPYRSRLEIRLRPSLFDRGDPAISAEVVKGGAIELTHSRNLEYPSVEARNAFKSSVLSALGIMVFEIAAVPDAQSYLDRLGEEDAFSRALEFSDVAIAIERILGATPKLSLSDWKEQFDGQRFVVKRKLPWDHGITPVAAEETRRKEQGPPLNPERMKHSGRRVMSVIDIPLWEKAKWQAAAYAGSDDPTQPPLLALGFEDESAAIKIFKDWRERLRNTDETEIVRVAILTGIDKAAPYAYTIAIGSEVSIEAVKASPGGLLAVSRILQMQASTPQNLNNFLREYRRVGRYVLAPAVFIDKRSPPKFLPQFRIEQSNLVVRPAWQIGDNDPDFVALSLNNDPVIPAGITNPPVHAALQRLRESEARRRPR